MIRVTIELLPGGLEPATRTHVMEIANVGGTNAAGNYEYRLFRLGGRTSVWKQGGIEGFPRMRLGEYDLVLRCLADALSERNGMRRT